MSFEKLITSLLADGKNALIFARSTSGKSKQLRSFYCRSVFFHSWSALEGWINYVCDSFADTDKSLSQFEIAFLRELGIQISEDGIVTLTNHDAFVPTLKKLAFVLRRFGRGYDIKSNAPAVWRELLRAQRIRHSLAHPKRVREIEPTLAEAESCYEAVLKTTEIIKSTIFKAG